VGQWFLNSVHQGEFEPAIDLLQDDLLVLLNNGQEALPWLIRLGGGAEIAGANCNNTPTRNLEITTTISLIEIIWIRLRQFGEPFPSNENGIMGEYFKGWRNGVCER
jgi:hypothetical protein